MKIWLRVLALLSGAALVFSLAIPAAGVEEPERDAGLAELGRQEAPAQMGDEAAQFQGVTPDQNAAAPRRAPELPEPGTYRDGQLLVKVARNGALEPASDLFGGLAETCELLFSVSEQDDVISPLSEDGYTADWLLLKLSGETDMLEAWEQLLLDDRVLAVEPNRLVHTQSIRDVSGNDPFVHAQTWLETIRAPEAWEAVTEGGKTPGEGVVVAVVDTGVDLDHPDLAANLWSDTQGYYGYDFIDLDSVPDDENGHGTHVAGIIAAGRNETGTVGVAYGAQIMPVRVLDKDGSGDDAGVISGIAYAVENGADIINLSLGGLGGSEAYSQAVQAARTVGVLVVAAAGNNALPTAYAGDTYYGADAVPATLPGVLTVMAMDTQADENGDWLASFSNYDADPGTGYEYELMAPGTDVLSTYPDGGYEYLSGTSMACPVVSGAAAVLLSAGCTGEQAWNCLRSSGAQRQGRTQPDGTVRRYRTLDLQAALAAKETAYQPVITNCALSASLSSVTMNGKTVNLTNLNTASYVYFQDSSFLSGLNLSLENLGAASGSITVTGTVGGATVSRTITSLTAGGTASVALTWSGLPTKSAAVQVNLTVTPHDARGNALTAIPVSRTFTAYDFTLPTGIVYNSASGNYRLDSSYVEVGSSDSSVIRTILCLPANLYVSNGQALVFQYGIIYEESGKQVEVASGGSILIGGANLLSNRTFNFTFDGTYSYGQTTEYPEYVGIISCSVQDPNIQGIKYLDSVEFFGTEGNKAQSKTVRAYLTTTSGFYYLTKLQLASSYFFYNMINNCINSTLTGTRIADNSFVDNGDYLSNSIQALKVYAPDYSAATNSGFFENCVIGPATVYRTGTSTGAVISDVYYQKVDASVTWPDGSTDTVLPSGVADSITCAASSYIYSDLATLYQSSYWRVCPAFVTGGYLTDYATDGCQVPYTLEYEFSTAVYDESPVQLYCYSPTDPFMQGRDVLDDTVFDSYSCALSGSTALTDLEMTEYYELGGYYTSSVTFSDDTTNYYWTTSMGSQSMYRFPIEFSFHSTWLDVAIVPDAGGKPKLSWSDENYETGYYAKVFRSVNDGEEEEELANVGTATSYTDTSVAPGNKYTYTVRIYSGSDKTAYSGSADYAGNTAAAGLLLDACSDAQTSSALTVAANEPLCFHQMELAVAYDEETFDLNTADFSDAVKNCGLPYGIRKTGADTAVVTIGQSSDSGVVLSAGDLLTLAVSNGDETVSGKTVAVTGITLDGTPAQDWGTDGCTFEIRQGSGKLIYNGAHSSASLWREATDPECVYVAGYGDTGRMLTVRAPEKGRDTDLAELAEAYPAWTRTTVFYLDAGSKPLADCVTLPRN